MDADLSPVVAVLAELDEGELAALIEAANHAPQIAPGLLAWIEGDCDWELNRRQGFVYPLLPPEAAIPLEEDAVSIDAANTIRARFAQDEQAESRAIVELFDAIVGLLTGGERTH